MKPLGFLVQVEEELRGVWVLVRLQGAAARSCRQNYLCFGVRLLVPLQGAAARWCCQSAVCALELGCWCCRRVPLQSAAERHCCQSAGCALEFCCLYRPLRGAAVKVPFALWSLVPGASARRCQKTACALELRCSCRCRVLLQGVAAGCRCRVPLQGAAVRVFGALLLVPPAARCCCQSAVFALELGSWCRCKGAARNLFALWSLVALEVGCWCRCRVPLQGNGARRCCQGAVCAVCACALELGCWCWCKVPVQGAAAGRRFRMPLLWSAAHVFLAIWGPRLRNLFNYTVVGYAQRDQEHVC